MTSRAAIRESFDPKIVKGSDTFLGREFPMSGSNYKLISGLAYKEAGIVLNDTKQEMVYSRLARRIRELKLKNFDEYLHYVKRDIDNEFRSFLNAITTNLTSFFREDHHFVHLKEVAIPLLRKVHLNDKRVRIWCSAASTGEEPYSIAMVMREAFAENSGWDIKILATDIDSNVLETARAGRYKLERVEGIPLARKKRWFKKISNDGVVVSNSLREMISFKQLNLLKPWPMKGVFDIVFCRNVIIYFDKETQRTLFDKVHQKMAEDALLYIGHSESLHNVSKKFSSLGKTIYKRN